MNSLPLLLYSDLSNHAPFKATVFARVHELEAIAHQLDKVVAMPKRAKNHWLKENEGLLQGFLDEFTHNAPLELDMTDVDQEMSLLLIEYTANLQELMRVVQGIYSFKKKAN